MFAVCVPVVLLLFGSFHTSQTYSIGIFPPGFPVIEISDDMMKRALPPMEGVAKLPSSMRDPLHGVKMGISSDICDNAKDNLEMDWDGSPENYTCYHPKYPLSVFKDLKPVEECDIPKGFYPQHVCMTEQIKYSTDLPTYGNHRPLWPVYGEYVFVPPQRWLHNLEHGAIVMLYHPCTEPVEVERLKNLVKGCIRKHVISPYALLPPEKPLALIAWGCKLQMNHVEDSLVTKFIKERALHGPEAQLAKQGQYSYKLLDLATTPEGSNYNDATLCPSA